MALNKQQLIAQHKDDNSRFKNIKGIMVISAKHFRFRKNQSISFSSSTLNWRVTNRTHNLRFAKPNHIAKVMDVNWKYVHSVVITNIRVITGSIAKKMARKLEPVVIFCNDSIENGKFIRRNY